MAQNTPQAAATALLIGVCIFVLALYYIHIPNRQEINSRTALPPVTASTDDEPAPVWSMYQAAVAIDEAPVRDLPGPQGKVVFRLAQGSTVRLVRRGRMADRHEGWLYIVGAQGESGWMPSAALKFDDDIPSELSRPAPEKGDPQSLPKQPRRPDSPRASAPGEPPVRCRNGQNNNPKQRRICLDQGGIEPVI